MTGWLAAGIAGVLALACSGKTADGTHPPDAGPAEAAPPIEAPDASSEPPDAPPLDAAEPEATVPDAAPDRDGSACDETRVLTGNFRVNQGGFNALSFIEVDRVRLAGVTAIQGSLALTDVRDLTLLRCLRRVSGDLSIGALTECAASGGCIVGTNPMLTSLEGLNQLEEVGGRLTLMENPVLVDMSALSALRRLGSLRVTSCPLLTGLSGLEGITSINELDISGAGLLSLTGLENLTTAATVNLAGNGNLASLSSLSSLTTVSSKLSIFHNLSLPDCEAEALATQVGMTCTPPDYYMSSPITCSGICTCDGNDGTGTCL